jgi:hypothetical protein
MTSTTKYDLADLLNDHDLTEIFQLYIFQCENCGIIVQMGQGIAIPVCMNGDYSACYCVCKDCNHVVRQRILYMRSRTPDYKYRYYFAMDTTRQ